METKEIIKHALKDYQNITGLRSYVVSVSYTHLDVYKRQPYIVELKYFIFHSPGVINL